MEQYLEACKAVSTHGIAGEVKVELWCDSAAFLSKFKTLYRGRQGQAPIGLIKARPQKNMALLKLEGINDMDAARALVGTVFYIDRTEAKLPKDHYFQADLPGCQVIDADDGHSYGVVKQVSQPAAQTIYTVEGTDGKLYFFPAVKPFLVKVEAAESRVLVRPIPGMFSEAEEGDKE